MDNLLALFWGCKNSLSLYEMDHKCLCVLALELFDVSGLSLLIKEINRLMLDVLTCCHNYIEYNCGCGPLETELCLAQVSKFW